MISESFGAEMESDTCCLCGVESELKHLKYIFDEVTNLAQIINETLPIKVSQDDCSKYICADCYNKVVSHHDFIQSVLAYSKKSGTNISFFEVNKNEKLENMIISNLQNDMKSICPNCNKDLIILLKSNPEGSDDAFEISLAVVDQIKELVEESQIFEDTMEYVDICVQKSIGENELHDLSLNHIVDKDMPNDKKNINGIYICSQEDTNCTNSVITLQKAVPCELNKGAKRKLQESVSAEMSNPIKLQKLEARLDVTEQDANELNSEHDGTSITDLITFHGMKYHNEQENEEENNIQEYTRKCFDKNLTKSQTVETISAREQNELNNDYDRSSTADLIIFQPENNDMTGCLSNVEVITVKEDSAADVNTTERECINEDDPNDIPKGDPKLVCNLCGTHYISHLKYKFHMERHKLNKIDKYVCLICDKETRNENLLWNHYLQAHKKPMRYVCLDCNKTFTKKRNFYEHQRKYKHSGYKEKLNETNEDKTEDQTEKVLTKQNRKCTMCRTPIKDVNPNAINDLTTCASCEDSNACLIIDGEEAKVISQRQYRCLKCRKHFMRQDRLEFHEMRHNENMDEHICSTCGKNFSGENSLFEHYLFVHKGVRPHICEVCGKSFQLKARLKEHYRKHTGEKPYQCEICGLRCMTTHALKFHKKSHCSTRHTCEICDKSFIKKQNLNEHLEKHWMKDENVSLTRIFTCPICNYNLPTFRMLRYHMTGIHQLDRQDLLIVQQKPLYDCNECQEKFKHQMSLKAHKEKVHEVKAVPRIFQCDICKAEFKIKQMLVKHIRSKHIGEKRYKCAKCNKKYMDIKTLYHHILLHTGRKPFNCEHCDMNFRRRDARDNHHRRKHTNSRPYQCTDCDESFGSYTSRSNHRKKVHENNETECPECKEKCGDKQEIRIHLNKHLGEKLSKL